MASVDPSLTMRDHLYSIDDRLKIGRPPPLLKSADEDIILDGEPVLEVTLVIYPTSISRCCIERDLFPAVPLFFQYPCGTSKGWSEWVDRELKDPSTCDILNRAEVLDAIFISKACDIHIEAKMLRHVVSQHPFHIVLTPDDELKLEALRKGAPSSPSTSPRFTNWIRFFLGDVNKNEPCRLVVLISLWLERFLFCDFSQNCLHERVFPLALMIACGSMLPLAPMFLGHLYRSLDQKPNSNTRVEEPNASGMPLEFVSDHERHVDIEPVVPTFEDTAGCSSEAGLGPPFIAIDTAQTVGKVEKISQGAENTLPTPPLGTSSVAADTSLYLPAAQPPAPPSPGTSDMAASTSSQLPAVLPPIPPCLGTFDTVVGTSSQLPVVLPHTPPILGTSSTAAGTSPQLPAVLPHGEIFDDSHKDGDAPIIGTFEGHLSEKSMSW
ncbi:unnamed protein product [Prunus armeniaca]